MAILNLSAGRPILDIDLGVPTPTTVGGYFDDGELGETGGNLYLSIDGEEYGSLFIFKRSDGTIEISLGAFDPAEEQWVEKSSLTAPVDYSQEG